MKDLINITASEKGIKNGFKRSNYSLSNPYLSKNIVTNTNSIDAKRTQVTRENLLTHDAYINMAAGLIPDLWNECRELFETFFTNQAPYSALQFVPVMQELHSINEKQMQRFLKNKETRHVLVDNELLKVVLIHWKPGKVSNIHGHPKGGCVFKILQGKLEELRYTTDDSHQLLSSNGYREGSMAYIDDRLGYHAVGNPFGTSAVSLHAYTPGK